MSSTFILEKVEYEGIQCKDDVGPLGVVVGVLLTVGILGSYLPQHVSLFLGKTSEGLSLRTMLVANLSGFTIILDSLLSSWDDFQCCNSHQISFGRCMRSTVLPVIQISVGWVALLPMYIMAIYYAPRNSTAERINWFREVVVFWIYVGFMILTTIIGAIVVLSTGSLGTGTKVYTDVIGVIAVVVTCFMWTPQIWEVFKQKGQGALSILMLLLQAPGAFLVVIYQAIISSESPVTWIPYLITGLSQVILIVQIVFYWMKNKNSPCHPKSKQLDPFTTGDDHVPGLIRAEELGGVLINEFDEDDDQTLLLRGDQHVFSS